jgi:hypothetical protein
MQINFFLINMLLYDLNYDYHTKSNLWHYFHKNIFVFLKFQNKILEFFIKIVTGIIPHIEDTFSYSIKGKREEINYEYLIEILRKF